MKKTIKQAKPKQTKPSNRRYFYMKDVNGECYAYLTKQEANSPKDYAINFHVFAFFLSQKDEDIVLSSLFTNLDMVQVPASSVPPSIKQYLKEINQ